MSVSEQIPIKDSAKRFRVAGSVKVVLMTEAGQDDPGQFPSSDVNEGIARFTQAAIIYLFIYFDSVGK